MARPKTPPNISFLDIFLQTFQNLWRWPRVLVEPDFDHDQVLREQVSCIVLCSLIESANEIQDTLPKARSYHPGNAIYHHVLECMGMVEHDLKSFLSAFTPDEFLSATSNRDFYLHGYYANLRAENIKCRWINDGGSVERGSRNSTLLRNTFKEQSGAITSIRIKMLMVPTSIWTLAATVFTPEWFTAVSYAHYSELSEAEKQCRPPSSSEDWSCPPAIAEVLREGLPLSPLLAQRGRMFRGQSDELMRDAVGGRATFDLGDRSTPATARFV
jgi:hypothetical protein